MMNSRNELLAALDAGASFEYLFFWGHKGSGIGPHLFSQWHPTSFRVGEDDYATAEHYMMAEKARLMGDMEMRREILRAADPAKAKALGRKVGNFDAGLWNKERLDVVASGNVAKFGSRPELRDYLLATGTKVLVEASPRDRIWGIGMGKSNEDARTPSKWRGSNLLGFALMRAREKLKAD